MQIAFFYIVLLMVQGFFDRALGALPAPDLFLLAAMTLVLRLPPWQNVLAAYGIGLLQDLIGQGQFGLHALGLSGGVLLAMVVRVQLRQTGSLENVLMILSALIAKWLVFAGLLLWLGQSRNPLPAMAQIAPIEIVLTLIVGVWLLPFSDLLFDRYKVLQKELLK